MAFNRGKESAYAEALEFCRQGLGYMGDEILLNVKSEMEQTVKCIKSEVAEIVENHNESLAAKLDSLSEKVQAMASKESNRSLSPEIRSREQTEANRRLVLRREEQILQINDQLTKMAEQLNKVNKKSEMDQLQQSLAGKIDLQKMLDVQSMHLLQKIREIQTIGAPDISLALQELEALKAPTFDFSQITTEIRKSMVLFEEDFRMLMNEIVKVQRHLEIDYLPIQSVGAVDHLSLQQAPAEVAFLPLPEFVPEETGPGEADPKEGKELEPSSDEVKETWQTPQTPASGQDVHIASRVKKMKRVREISAQTETYCRDEHVQTDTDFSQNKHHHHHKKKLAQAKTKVAQPVAQKKLGLQDKDAFKERARKALLRKQYNVFDFYHTEGICQLIARHYIFDNLTVSIVALNAIWIAIDIDYNKSAILTEAESWREEHFSAISKFQSACQNTAFVSSCLYTITPIETYESYGTSTVNRSIPEISVAICCYLLCPSKRLCPSVPGCVARHLHLGHRFSSGWAHILHLLLPGNHDQIWCVCLKKESTHGPLVLIRCSPGDEYGGWDVVGSHHHYCSWNRCCRCSEHFLSANDAQLGSI